MVEAVINREKWAPLSKGSSPSSWGKRAQHYLFVGSDIARLARGEHTLPSEPVLADGLISELNRLYEFRGGLVVEDFLRENLHLGGLLLEAYKVIREKFGFETRVILEVVIDPDGPVDQELFVIIRSRFRPKIARALLTELDREWWRDASRAAQGKMELDLE